MLTHTRPGTIPAALATAEVAKRNGQDFILCFMLGFEIAIPTEKCSGSPEESPFKGITDSITSGALEVHLPRKI